MPENIDDIVQEKSLAEVAVNVFHMEDQDDFARYIIDNKELAEDESKGDVLEVLFNSGELYEAKHRYLGTVDQGYEEKMKEKLIYQISEVFKFSKKMKAEIKTELKKYLGC
ncbi:hypothetical protein GF336_06445 [Candidatus Woesearchaeota archaeon]|nr:hypothetical protein [Candidatus Woesearchaeota archaeon]